MVVIAAIGVMAIVGTTLWLLVAGIAGRNSAPRVTPGWAPQSVLEAAFLVGGPSRVVDTVISTMHESERVRVVPQGRLQVLRPVAANGIEAAVLAACGPEWQADLEEVRASAMRSPAVQEIGDGLAAHGLLYRPDSIRNWRLAARVQRVTCFLTGFALIGTTVITVIVGQAGGLGGLGVFSVFPVFICVVVASVIGHSLAPRGRLTKAGKNAVAQLRRSNPWVPEGTAAWGPAVPALVAIGGAEVLTPGPLRDELMASAAVAGAGRTFGGPSSSSDSSSSDPGGAAWCGSSSGGCGGGSGCGASSCGGASSGGGGSSCGGGGGGCGGGGGGGGG
jgi:uncharacterized protein (TIGR04222 family)